MALLPSVLSQAASDLYTFTTFTFGTPTSGRTGPTLSQIQTMYSGRGQPWTQNTAYLNMTTQGIQRWTVPATATYRIEAKGAEGGVGQGRGPNGGRGAIIRGDIALTKSQVIQILVGHYGGNVLTSGPGGGGGSFVVTSDGTPLIIAGGGGAGASTFTAPGGVQTASTTTSGNFGGSGSSGGSGGTNGGGGSLGSATSSIQPGSGAGFSGNGLVTSGSGMTAAQSFLNGGVGGFDPNQVNEGGFGGGGVGNGTGTTGNSLGGGGGGGYSGGGGGTLNGGGGGGGSYVSGTNQVVSTGQTVNGEVVITKL